MLRGLGGVVALVATTACDGTGYTTAACDGTGHTTAACNHMHYWRLLFRQSACNLAGQAGRRSYRSSLEIGLAFLSLSICTMLRPLGMLMHCQPTILRMIHSHQAPRCMEVFLRPPRIAKRIRGGMHAWLQSADSSSGTHAAKKTKTIYRLKTTTGPGSGRPCHI